MALIQNSKASTNGYLHEEWCSQSKPALLNYASPPTHHLWSGRQTATRPNDQAAKRPSCRTAKLPTDQAAKRPNYQRITLNAHKRAGLLSLGY